MKKLLIVISALCLLLAGCGRADKEKQSPAPASESPSATAEPEPSQEPLIRITQEERERQMTEKGMDIFTYWGSFLVQNRDYEQFISLPQDEPTVFTVRNDSAQGEATKKIQEFEAVYIPIQWELAEIEAAAWDGRKIEGYTYGEDTSQWASETNEADRQYLPLEYLQLRDRMHEMWVEMGPQIIELQKQRNEERNQSCLETAKLFAEADCKTEVWALRAVEDYEEQLRYICFVTTTPKKLLELGETIDGEFFVEPQHEIARLNHDVPIWSSEDETT